MAISLILVPYHLGHPNKGMGAGPIAFLHEGVDSVIRDAGHEVEVTTVELKGRFGHEVGATFRVDAQLSDCVGDAVAADAFPLVLAGNCNSCLGTLAGVGGSDIGVIWFDAHGDFNSPETSRSGFLDGMSLNIATGRSWTAAVQTIPGFTPVSDASVALVGVRDLDPAESDLLQESAVSVCDYVDIRKKGVAAGLGACLDALAARTRKVYVHVDLDVLDPKFGRANEFAPPGGLKPGELRKALEMVAARFDVQAANITAYNPTVDKDGRALQTGLDMAEKLAALRA